MTSTLRALELGPRLEASLETTITERITAVKGFGTREKDSTLRMILETGFFCTLFPEHSLGAITCH